MGLSYEYGQLKVTEKIKAQIESLVKLNHVGKKVKDHFKIYLDPTEPKTSISFKDVKVLKSEINSSQTSFQTTNPSESSIYLCDLLDGSELCLPSVEPVKRSPELEARLARLQVELDQKKYNRMTRNVQAPRLGFPQEESIGAQYKHLNKYVTMILNFVLTVLGAFVFGYYITELQMGYKDTGTQILIGVCLATAVFIADLYFVVKQDFMEL